MAGNKGKKLRHLIRCGIFHTALRLGLFKNNDLASFKIIQIEFGILGFFASLFGSLVSIGISFAISSQVFDSIWKPSWEINLIPVILITTLSITVALLAKLKVLKQKPISLLQTT
ncbi:MAG: hypothetical protein HQK84_09370 [Nitrospinae bacterium]|nr:hypothetical protein [Nitrospinota bacterium]